VNGGKRISKPVTELSFLESKQIRTLPGFKTRTAGEDQADAGASRLIMRSTSWHN